MGGTFSDNRGNRCSASSTTSVALRARTNATSHEGLGRPDVAGRSVLRRVRIRPDRNLRVRARSMPCGSARRCTRCHRVQEKLMGACPNRPFRAPAEACV